ncbi:threonine/serine exporter family protein [Terrilactibacillus laevilacticus]|uniref:Threonine/serine exporter family protein n=1 Tax=Terrilactibacillus laevilacticus TaxID=1380157 RepID=A0ABW5PV70_9BACI|nr:threonine/serine exporter family protein [Terrilactibacillus laevilacticus]
MIAQQSELKQDVAKVCMLAGKIMLQNGAETYRVEDTMNRIAASYHYPDANSFVTPTGIIFSIEGINTTRLYRIKDRGTDLYKVTLVNSLSRVISEGQLSVSAAYEKLKNIEENTNTYPKWLHVLSASIISGCFLIMFNGTWNDFIPAMLSGGIGYAINLYTHAMIKVRFLSEMFSAFIIAVIAFVIVAIHYGTGLDVIIISSLMPLVPGVLITNAVRDLMAGDLVSGLSKGAESMLTALAMGVGVALVFSIF